MLWVLCAIAALALGLASIILGLNILPSFGKASEAGTFIPLLVGWALVATAVGTALALAKFLISQKSRV